jgi:eukaryotic-like serine/threonine-protein kinase
MNTTQYCPVCGAANEQTSIQCFACTFSLTQLQTEQGVRNEALLQERYHLEKILGSGGFSTVYRAGDQQTARTVAIKQVNLHGLTPAEIIEATHTFHREVSLLSTLHHPQIPQLYESFSDRDHWYLVLQYLEGITLETDLEARAAQGRVVSLDEAIDLALQLCAVLDYLHTQEPPVIFRDLKPGNIMRTAEGKICLIDFGIARFFRPGQARDTQRLGSPGYAAPEQYGRAQTTPQSDIYSLGVLLHALLTGDDPAERGLTPLHLEQEVGGTHLATCVQRMVAPAPSARPTSVREVTTMLEAIQQHRQSQSAARIWHPPIPQTPVVSSQTVSSQRHHQIQHPVLPGKVPSPPATRRMTRRNALIGLGTLTAATVGGAIWWTTRSASHLPSSSAGSRARGSPPPPPDTYHGPVYVYRDDWMTGFVGIVAWSPDSRRIASSGVNGTVQVWDASDGGHPFTHGGQTNVGAAAWSPDGQRIASSNGTVEVWNATTGELLVSYQAQASDQISHEGMQIAPRSVAWSPDGQRIVSAAGTVHVWDAMSGRQLFSYQGQSSNVVAVAWSPDGRHIASMSLDNPVQVWDATTGEHTLTYGEPNQLFITGGLAWSPDSGRIVSLRLGGVDVWDARTGEHTLTYLGHQSNVNAAAWSPDSKFIVSGSDDGTAQVWSSLDGRRILTFGLEVPKNGGTYTGHGKVYSVAWSPDGKHIASGTSDGTAQVWNAPEAP